MKHKAIALALTAACSMVAVPMTTQAAHPGDTEAARVAAQQSHPELRQAIQELQAARYELTRADRRFGTNRGDAVEEVQNAMDHLFAAVGDRQWEEQDKELRQRQRKEGEEAAQRRDNRPEGAIGQPAGEQQFFRMNNALHRLEAAENHLQGAGGGFAGHKARAVEFIRQAKESVREGIEHAGGDVAARPADVRDDHDAQPAAAQTHPELRRVIQDLQAARYELSRADRKFFTERGDAREQVQYALTQLFAAVGDKNWEEQDKQLWDKQKREGDLAARDRGEDHATPAAGPYFRMQNALKRLESAREGLDDATTADAQHKEKALTFIREAEKAINIGMDKARAAAADAKTTD